VNRICFAVFIFGSLWINPSTAAESCPWLNSATAAGVLGGEVTIRVVHSTQNKEDANCEFIRAGTAVSETLSIQVISMTNVTGEFPSFLAKCGGTSTAVRGIGNEAVACTLRDKHGKRVEQVVGRVRNRAFLIRIESSDKSVDTASLRETAEKTAEQIAGILF